MYGCSDPCVGRGCIYRYRDIYIGTEIYKYEQGCMYNDMDIFIGTGMYI